MPELRLPDGIRRRFGSLSKSGLVWALVVLTFRLAFLGYDWCRLLRVDPQLLAELSDQARERRSFTPLASIPRQVALAAVASEDRRFFRHMGLDLLVIWSDTAPTEISALPLQGGRTISQQLAKN